MCWMFSSLEHTGEQKKKTNKTRELIRSHQFKLNVILYLSDTIRASLIVEFDVTRINGCAPHCIQTSSPSFKNSQIGLDIRRHR